MCQLALVSDPRDPLERAEGFSAAPAARIYIPIHAAPLSESFFCF